MNILDAVILGLVEGITEYLPVSSTGHLIITADLLGLDKDPAVKNAVDSFNIVIQGGAILAVLGLYWPRVLRMLKGLLGKDPVGLRLAINIVVAFLPAACIGLLIHKHVKHYLFSPGPVLAALFLGGVWMLWLDRRHKRLHTPGDNPASPRTPTRELALDDMTWKHALLVGCFQIVAMWPGASRSMMTIAGGVTIGLKPKDAAEFSFLLGLPTLGAACLYDLYKNLSHARTTGDPNLFQQLGVTPVIVGIIVAAASAAVAVRWLVGFLTRHGLGLFGWYRIALSIVFATLIATGLVTIN